MLSLGDLVNAVQNLEMFVEVADHTKQYEQICEAQSSLGAMYNTLGQFSKAIDCFNKSYDLAQKWGDSRTLASSCIRYGVGAAHGFFHGYSEHVGDLQVSLLLAWKDVRETIETRAQETLITEEMRSVEMSNDLESGDVQE